METTQTTVEWILSILKTRFRKAMTDGDTERAAAYERQITALRKLHPICASDCNNS
jgi:hypothetical protein